MTTPARDSIEVDALRTDHYLQALLEAHDRRAIDTPSDAALDPAVRSAALRLGRELIRVHPSFRFEERLAQRLAGIAAGLQLPAAAGAEGRVIPLAPSTPIAADIDPATGDPAATSEHGLPRPLILGGAMASAAISIAGAAFVAWWRLRPATTPMSRAVRAARQLRLGRVVIDRPGPTRLLD
ncbi:MAG TPA: hypothetical protein VH720_11520 [Candidatus Limnocylindrales bacterium]